MSIVAYDLLSCVCLCVAVMEYVPRGELFSAWKHYGHFSEALVQIYIAELAMVIGKLPNSSYSISFIRHIFKVSHSAASNYDLNAET